ncbi:MAG: MBL fold metallo-hydrolase [Desulfotalea sp.]
MYATFLGAAREVTGSFHTLTTIDDTVLLDCGMFQGRRKEAEQKNKNLPIDPRALTNVVLSHAHIDHSGRLPMLVEKGFAGEIFCSRPTVDACTYLLRDSAHIQEGDANYLNYKTARNFLARIKKGDNPNNIPRSELKIIQTQLKSGDNQLKNDAILKLLKENNLQIINPLYSKESAERSLEHFVGLPYKKTFTIGKNLTCTFYEAGHILGSAISIIQRKNSDGTLKTIMYTGDLGRFDKPIIKDPCLDFAPEHRDIDLCITESTYGNRLHDPVVDMKPKLKEVLLETFERGGSVIIPAFAYGRTQELIYYIHELYREGEVPHRPVYVDSPLATNITQVFGEHPEVYDKETHKNFLEEGINPFNFQHLTFVQNVEESMQLNRNHTSHIVLAGSGMCEGGRILHHLRHKIHDERNTILIVGYMGKNTFGRRIQEKAEEYEAAGRQGDAPIVRFYNKDYPLKAKVVTLGGFSGHGDRDELGRVLTKSNLRIKKAAIVHGEEEQAASFASYLQETGIEVVVPYRGQSLII